MKHRKKTNILFLHGIKENDFKTIEDLFESKIQQCFAEESKEQMLSKYDTIPKRFYNIDTWIKGTNLKCWNCSRKFNGVPLFIPICTLIDENGNEYFEVSGNFCKINCAYTYAYYHYKNHDAVDMHARLLLLHYLFYGFHVLKIPLSPEKHEMQDYGGDLTVEEYEKEIDRRNNDQNLTKYKLEHFKIDSDFDMLD